MIAENIIQDDTRMTQKPMIHIVLREETTTAVGAVHVLDQDLLTVADIIDLVGDAEMMRSEARTEAHAVSETVVVGVHQVRNPSHPHRSRQRMNVTAERSLYNNLPLD